MADRTNVFTDVALEAIDELETLINELIGEFSIPLGTKLVPDSTRRARGKQHAQALSDLLVKLSRQFGPDQVQEVLGAPLDNGSTIFEEMVNQYGEEAVARAMALTHLGLQAEVGTPDAQRYLPTSG